jgi:hypothetical protein
MMAEFSGLAIVKRETANVKGLLNFEVLDKAFAREARTNKHGT